jgi:hypothetical protein
MSEPLTIDRIDDDEWQEATITKVAREDGGYAVEHDGWTLWVQHYGVRPKVGDTIRTYGPGIGHEVRGIAINGRIVRYESERVTRRSREQAERDKADQDKAAADRSVNDARIAALPIEFQVRIARFRRNNPEFEWRYQPYELFVCEQSVAFAKRYTGDLDGLRAFAQSTDWAWQQTQVPELSGEHSGNTFGAACRLAWIYLDHPELVEKEHGALCPLVVCDAYGCFAAEVKAA